MTPSRGALSEAGETPERPKGGPQDAEQEKERPMFAVLKTGGKQYKVQAGDVLRVEKLDAVAGEKIQFNDILMVGTTIGAPMVAGAAVQAEVIDQIKGEKTIHYVKRRRKHSLPAHQGPPPAPDAGPRDRGPGKGRRQVGREGCHRHRRRPRHRA